MVKLIKTGSSPLGRMDPEDAVTPAKFPGIRNVLCYLPLNWQSMKEITDDYMFLGNEVVFDDLDALNQALASDVMREVQADSEQFAVFGYSTHHAMQRSLVYTRDDR